MIFKLTPHWIGLNILNLPLDTLWQEGIRGFVFDLDNTLMPPKAGVLSEAITDWLHHLEARGFSWIVVSNNKNKAYCQAVQATIGKPVLAHAAKPSTKRLKEAVSDLGLPLTQIAIVGDRPLTDSWGAQRLGGGVTSVLVDPLMRAQEHGIKHLLRAVERLPVQHTPTTRYF
jgi:uncharacterized protein